MHILDQGSTIPAPVYYDLEGILKTERLAGAASCQGLTGKPQLARRSTAAAAAPAVKAAPAEVAAAPDKH